VGGSNPRTSELSRIAKCMRGRRSLRHTLEQPIDDPETVIRRKHKSTVSEPFSLHSETLFGSLFDSPPESPVSPSKEPLNTFFANMGDAADAKTIASYSRATNTATLASPVVIPPLANADDKAIKIKGYIYTRMTDFNGLSSQNPYEHLDAFDSLIDDIAGLPAAQKKRVCLTLFPKTLKDRAKQWFNMLAPKSITTWDQMTNTFLSKYFPIARTQEIRGNIMSFVQGSQEEFHEC